MKILLIYLSKRKKKNGKLRFIQLFLVKKSIFLHINYFPQQNCEALRNMLFLVIMIIRKLFNHVACLKLI